MAAPVQPIAPALTAAGDAGISLGSPRRLDRNIMGTSMCGTVG
jgi:hypothetical protein